MEACNPPTIQDSNETQFLKGLREFRASYREWERTESNNVHTQNCRNCRNLRRNFRNAGQEMVDLAVGASDTCSICLEEYTHKNVMFSVPCIHTFHVECFLQWNRDHDTCPLCMLHCSGSYLNIGSEVSRGRLRYTMQGNDIRRL